MPAMAKARFVRVSPTKARRVMDLIRGRSLQEAEAILGLSHSPTAREVAKVLHSAAANAENNHDMDRDVLWVREGYVDQGPGMRRMRPASQGRVTVIRRPTSHITVVMEEREELKQAAARRAGRRRKETGPRRGRAARGESPSGSRKAAAAKPGK
jgi:large subunit ribosomal protein L22